MAWWDSFFPNPCCTSQANTGEGSNGSALQSLEVVQRSSLYIRFESAMERDLAPISCSSGGTSASPRRIFLGILKYLGQTGPPVPNRWRIYFHSSRRPNYLVL